MSSTQQQQQQQHHHHHHHQSRRRIMQPWPLCLASFGKPKERAILPKQYSRVPSIARSSSSQLVQDCSSNSTLLSQVSPFASQLGFEALADQPQACRSEPEQQQQHYYADNLRNNQHKTLNGSRIYHEYRQLEPLLSKDEPASDTKTLMESQDLEKPTGQAVPPGVPQFQKAQRRRNRPYYLTQVLAAFSVSIGSMVVGFASSYTSPALVTMKDNTTTSFLVDETTSSWIGSIMPLSALVGGIVGGPLIENVGRRNTILSLSAPFFLSWLLIGFARNVGMVLAGRSLGGFCVGVITLAMPVYLGETIQPEVRGTLGLLPTAFGNIGILLCFTVGMFLNWWQLALAAALVPVPFAALMLIIPETPRWYIARGQAKRARKSLQWLRGPGADVSEELSNVEKMHVESEREANQSGRSELLKRRNLKPLAISLGLMFFQQMSGINAVIFYTVHIFLESGSEIDGNLSTVIVGVVNFGSTFLATAVIDHLGRKVLLYMSSLSMIASLGVLGTYFYLKDNHFDIAGQLGWLPLASFVIYVLGFSLGFGPVPWLMMGEILPAKIRGSAASIVTGFNWSCTFVVTKMFTTLTTLIGWSGTFWLFGAICLAGFVFVRLFVPETSGRSLEEIERGLTGAALRRMSAVANIKPTPMAC
ncbi:facilitated trehalose transporter Tret1-like [Phymastichus coffea]|uniref:facilitated trehalose transporter Tret1-like n=1 Tax=Phymastichus coffea TaxID=108790 RepID=UPI00273CE4D3|nr:facilitated trehalose transporter Tret1-like [Phymastichus coffea]